MRLAGLLGAAWGAIGVAALLLSAVYRLAPKAMTAYEQGLSTSQWWITAAVVLFLAYAEGYRGFQGGFSPRTAARVRYLRDHPGWTRSLLAPLFAMGFFHATRRTRITAFALSSGMVLLVLLVHRLDQPWRGIIDAGVVVGLVWGLASLAWFTLQALAREDFGASPQVPGREQEVSRIDRRGSSATGARAGRGSAP
jgi:hypothetical protein